MTIEKYALQLSLEPRVTLFDIDLTDLGGTIQRFTPMSQLLGAAGEYTLTGPSGSADTLAYDFGTALYTDDNTVYVKLVYKKDVSSTEYHTICMENATGDVIRILFRDDATHTPRIIKLQSYTGTVNVFFTEQGDDYYCVVFSFVYGANIDTIKVSPGSGAVADFATDDGSTASRSSAFNLEALSLEMWEEAASNRLVKSDVPDFTETDWVSVGGGSAVTVSHQATAQITASLNWKGYAYTPLPIEAEGFEMSTDGALPRPRISVANVLGTVTSLTKQYQNLLGAKVTRWRTYHRYLDDGATPDPNAHLPVDIFFVDRKTTQSKTVAEWELASVLDQQDVKLPARQVLRSGCQLLYRRYDSGSSSFDYTDTTCPYVGTSYFDENDDATADPAEDKCSQQLTGCRLRFSGEIPFGGFPSVGRIRR